MAPLLDNFQDFITRVGFKILQVPETPQEYVGRHLLLTYLDSFVKTVGGVMTFEVPTGAGKMDLLIVHNQQKYIVETKIWRGDTRYQAGKRNNSPLISKWKASAKATMSFSIIAGIQSHASRQKPWTA